MRMQCDVCGYEWDSRKDVPKQCPKCKRYLNYTEEKQEVQDDSTN